MDADFQPRKGVMTSCHKETEPARTEKGPDNQAAAPASSASAAEAREKAREEKGPAGMPTRAVAAAIDKVPAAARIKVAAKAEVKTGNPSIQRERRMHYARI